MKANKQMRDAIKDANESANGQSELTAGLDARFLVSPQLVDIDYGPEPSLYTILCSYCKGNDLTPEQARKYAVRYSQAWAKQLSNIQINRQD